MTIAISLKVNDGIVLAADSAATLASGEGVVNVYNNANKICNLVKGLPIGMVTWGLGNIGPASMSTLMKDLRRRLSGEHPQHPDWGLNRANYQLAEVAARVKEFFHDEKFIAAFAEVPAKPGLGFIVAGYSSDSEMADEYRIQIMDGSGTCMGPDLQRGNEETGVSWSGQPEAITRLVLGYATELPQILMENFGVEQKDIRQVMEVIKSRTAIPLVQAAMPIQDAIDLAEFLAYAAVSFSRFMPGAPVVGGPIEVAAITKHEGFKWIKRKYYYSREINPEGPSWPEDPE